MASTEQLDSVPNDHAAMGHVNEVRLLGVLAGTELRALPSGDELLTFRVTVRRPPPPARSRAGVSPTRRAPSVDAIECIAGTPAAVRAIRRCTVGEAIEITGRLQRRFWRSAAGPASTYQVEASAVRRLRGERSRQSSGS